MKSPSRMAYWLVPSEPYFSEIQNLVNELAEKFDGPKFIPHITLYSGLFTSNDSIEKVSEALKVFRSFSICCKALEFNNQFKESCFLEFEKHSILSELNAVIKNQCMEPDSREVSSHMSLFYGALTDSQRIAIRSQVVVPEVVSFSIVYAISNDRPVKDREDIENERVVAKMSL
jgi:hypothetical protein